ncbi:MAG: helix-turn-helix transcriptional regulator [Clostridia bacterium]|nr:helix-turn-helix transcriptional regulator [Clostridia bacterium]
MTSGERLRTLRMERGLTQLRLAVAAGTTPSFVNLMERWGYVPGADLRRRIASVLGVQESDIWPETLLQEVGRQ